MSVRSTFPPASLSTIPPISNFVQQASGFALQMPGKKGCAKDFKDELVGLFVFM